MPVTTYTEYLEAANALEVARVAASDAIKAERRECHDRADAQFEATTDAIRAALAAPPQPPSNAREEAAHAEEDAAQDIREQQKADCDQTAGDQMEAVDHQYLAQSGQLEQEASDGLAKVQRLIITLDELLSTAEALQDISWYDNQTPVPSAPIFIVSSLGDLRQEFERDRFTFELLLMVRAENGELVFGNDRRTISQIVSDVQNTVKLQVQETFNLRGELIGAAPNDTDSLRIFGTWSIHVAWTQISAATLVGLAVKGATQKNVTGRNNWVALKKSGSDVIVEAETAPRNNPAEWRKIQWSGGSPVRGHPNLRRLSRAASRKYHVEASLDGSRDYVDLWVIWARIVIKATGMRPANAAPFDPATLGGGDRLGPDTYDRGTVSVIDEEQGLFVDNIGARAKVAPVATLTPKQVSAVLKSGWAFKRQIQCHDWIDGYKTQNPKAWTETWTDDTSNSEYLRLTPDIHDKIYDLDGPNIPFGNRSSETYNNFRQWIELDGERCSDFAPWYWRARWHLHREPSKQVTLNELGEGQVKLPTKAHYQKS